MADDVKKVDCNVLDRNYVRQGLDNIMSNLKRNKNAQVEGSQLWHAFGNELKVVEAVRVKFQ